ncbi:MAG: hypothetical protein A2Z96_01980 [Spirochaetes bacterium GWB1_48_6]|nr:MAG: hypothetical protein A2Z96_01980 [Spirochaetes bacterium GWB1_48_6]
MQFVEGLAFDVNGSAVAVSRQDKSESPIVTIGAPVRFFFERPVAISAQQDIAVFIRGSGRVDIRLFTSRQDKQPVASGSFELLEGKAAELRIFVPARSTIAAAELTLSDGDFATITAFSVRTAFVGARFDTSSYIVDGGTTFSGVSGSHPESIVVSVPQQIDSSLILGLTAGGTARISTLAQNGIVRPVFDATVRSDAEVAIPLAAFGGTYRIVIESSTGLSFALFAPGNSAPLADLHAILAISAALSGDYSLYRWDLFPETLVFDFADYAVQDRYLKRLAFFAEKPGFRGRIASDEEIGSLHGWNAHDYSTGTLFAFYSKALGSGISLNREELSLLDLLVERGVLTRNSSGAIGEGRGAIISVSRESTPGLRRVFMDHESSHALFFQDAEYRKLSAKLWASLGPEAKSFWMQHLAWRRYDTRDDYLRINELQAYLVQQPVSSTQAYYEALIERLAEAYPEDRERLEAEASYAVESAIAGATVLDSYLRKRWGLSAGKFGRIWRL